MKNIVMYFITIVTCLALKNTLNASPIDTSKIIIGIKYLVYDDMVYGGNHNLNDTISISYYKTRDLVQYRFLKSSPNLENWIFVMYINDKAKQFRQGQSLDSLLVTENKQLFLCAYIVAFNVQTEALYRLKGFKKMIIVFFARS